MQNIIMHEVINPSGCLSLEIARGDHSCSQFARGDHSCSQFAMQSRFKKTNAVLSPIQSTFVTDWPQFGPESVDYHYEIDEIWSPCEIVLCHHISMNHSMLLLIFMLVSAAAGKLSSPRVPRVPMGVSGVARDNSPPRIAIVNSQAWHLEIVAGLVEATKAYRESTTYFLDPKIFPRGKRQLGFIPWIQHVICKRLHSAHLLCSSHASMHPCMRGDRSSPHA